MQHLAAYYSGTAKLLHWLIAGFVVALLSVALTMTRIGDLQLKYELYQLHKSMGVTVLGLMILRLAWRLAAKPRRCRTWRPGSAARPRARMRCSCLAAGDARSRAGRRCRRRCRRSTSRRSSISALRGRTSPSSNI